MDSFFLIIDICPPTSWKSQKKQLEIIEVHSNLMIFQNLSNLVYFFDLIGTNKNTLI